MEAELMAAYAASRAEQGEPVELYAMLNRLVFPLDERQWLDQVDDAIDRLYRAGRLHVRGHRWLSDRPASIRGNLVAMFDKRFLQRVDGRWCCNFAEHIFVR
jgi:hypothetical protein